MTRRYFTLFFVFIASFLFSQAPQFINYQGIARNPSANLEPIVNTTVNLTLKISSSGVAVYEENHSSVTNAAGIFVIQIGKGQNPSSTFSLIPWGTADYTLDIYQNGNLIASQLLASVPYALYSENAAKPNLSLTGNTLQVNNSTISIPSGTDSQTLSVTSSSLSAAVPATLSISNGNSILLPRPLAGTNVSITPFVTYPLYTISSHPTLSVNAANDSIAISGGNKVAIPSGPWTKNLNHVTLKSSSDLVGIGMPTPLYRLHVIESNPSYAIFGVNTHTTTSNGAASGIYGSSINTNSLSVGINGEHFANGIGVRGINSSNTSSTGIGVYGLSQGTTTNNVGILGDAQSGNAIAIRARSILSSNGPAFHAYKNTTSGTTAIIETDNSFNPADVLFVKTSGSGKGVRSETQNGSAVHGNSSGAQPTIFGENLSDGPSVIGLKNTGGGEAAIFEIKNNANTYPTLKSHTDGSGPAVQASVGTGTNSKLALSILNGGHIKATGPALVSATISTSGGFISPSVSCTDCNDVRGSVTVTVSITGVATGNKMNVRVNFNKSYSNPPKVIISPFGQTGGLEIYVNTVTNSDFEIMFTNPYSSLTLMPPGTLRVDYIVIE